MLTTERVNHLQHSMWFFFSVWSVFVSLPCALFFALVLHLCYLTLASHYFIENSLFHFSDAVFSLCLSLFRFHCALFTHRTSNEIYQCQMKHRILLNHIQSFSKWTRLKRSDLLVVFFACVGNRCHHRDFIIWSFIFMIHWEFCLDSFTLWFDLIWFDWVALEA